MHLDKKIHLSKKGKKKKKDAKDIGTCDILQRLLLAKSKKSENEQ